MPNGLIVQRFIRVCRRYGQGIDRIDSRCKDGVFDQIRPGRLSSHIQVREIAGFARVGRHEYEMQVRLDPDEPMQYLVLKAHLWRHTLDKQGERIEGKTKILDGFYTFGLAIAPQDNPREYFEEQSVERLFTLIGVKKPEFLDFIQQFNSFVSAEEESN